MIRLRKQQYREVGAEIEKLASIWLGKKGLTIVEKNFRSRFGEIDLIATDQSFLVFVEVRYRRNSTHGTAAATVNYRKQKKLIATAEYYLARHPEARNRPCRFDVLAVTSDAGKPIINWYKAAFSLDDTTDYVF